MSFRTIFAKCDSSSLHKLLDFFFPALTFGFVSRSCDNWLHYRRAVKRSRAVDNCVTERDNRCTKTVHDLIEVRDNWRKRRSSEENIIADHNALPRTCREIGNSWLVCVLAHTTVYALKFISPYLHNNGTTQINIPVAYKSCMIHGNFQNLSLYQRICVICIAICKTMCDAGLH